MIPILDWPLGKPQGDGRAPSNLGVDLEMTTGDRRAVAHAGYPQVPGARGHEVLARPSSVVAHAHA
jgi:hypothetical protein